ncbi:MAG: Lysine-specific demethylase 7A [Watsoniomyces obsoletus]|nr:MAG: Lysine-specific demethylase 7A [Watsoniomyces obsoletus]
MQTIQNSTQLGGEDIPESRTLTPDPAPKDVTEAELEKLVFGDETEFLQGIRAHEVQTTGGSADEELDGWQDSDLFFLDAGDAETRGTDLVGPASLEVQSDHTFGGADRPAWEDSDDEKILVSLATNTRLRKLRTYEGEDLVNGREYIKRLRRQFERLNPVPEWVKYATEQHRSRERRRSSRKDPRLSDDDEAISEDQMDVDDEELSAQPLGKLLRSVDGLAIATSDGSTNKRKKLRAEVLDIQRTRDVGGTQPSAITSLQFHPIHPILLSSGPSSTLYLHRVSPSDSTNPNPLLTSLHVRHTPISTTAFEPPHGNRIFLSGQRRYFHIWDLPSGTIEKVTRVQGHGNEQRKMERFKLSPCGRWMGLVGTRRKGGVGVVNILDAQTTQWIAEARIGSHGGIADFAWWHDGEGLTIAGKAGDIIEYDLTQRCVVGQWTDEGAVGTTVIALGGGSVKGNNQKKADHHSLGGDRYIAVGSSSGIVNIYDRRSWFDTDISSPPSSASNQQLSIPSRPKPLRALQNLTTPTSHLVFSPDGQVLAISSRWKKDALRLVHLPSCTVYRNWPTAQTPLGRITSVAFSPDSRLLAVANEAGKIRLWEIMG